MQSSPVFRGENPRPRAPSGSARAVPESVVDVAGRNRLNERFMDNLQVTFTAFQRSDGNLIDGGTPPIKYYANSATAPLFETVAVAVAATAAFLYPIMLLRPKQLSVGGNGVSNDGRVQGSVDGHAASRSSRALSP
jgi:hypothetical protein